MYSRDGETAFVQWGKNQGARISSDGLGMLVEQAAESFYLCETSDPTHGVFYRHCERSKRLRPPARTLAVVYVVSPIGVPRCLHHSSRGMLPTSP